MLANQGSLFNQLQSLNRSDTDTNNPDSVLKENPEKARVTINNWISNKTENLIQDTLPQGALDSNTILVLVNTIYFKVPELLPQTHLHLWRSDSGLQMQLIRSHLKCV